MTKKFELQRSSGNTKVLENRLLKVNTMISVQISEKDTRHNVHQRYRTK